MTASTQADFTPLKLMVPGFVSWVHLALEGARTNVFGWGCPLYWTQPSLSILCLVFVIGLILGASLCLLAIWTFWTSFGHLITPSAAAAQGSISRNPRYSAPTEHLYESSVRRRQGHWAGLQAGCSPYHCAWASWACCELHQGHLLQGRIIHLFFATSSVSQRALLIWFQRVVLLLSLLVSLRQGTRLQQLWSLPPLFWSPRARSWVVHQHRGLKESRELGWRASKLPVTSGRVHSPNHSPQLDLRPRFYVVLRAPGLERPTIYKSAKSYWEVVGDFAASSAISHAFPPKQEAKVFLAGAGVAEYDTCQWWWTQWMPAWSPTCLHGLLDRSRMEMQRAQCCPLWSEPMAFCSLCRQLFFLKSWC